MFKKIVAVTLAAIIMITPMTASAVTWGTVVAQLNASGSYSGEGVEASVADGAVTVQGSTGATIEGDIDEWHETPAINIHVGQVDGVNKYSFQNVTFNDDVLMNGDGVGLEVTFGTGTTVNADMVEVGVYNGGTASFTNEGTINADLNTWGDTGSLAVTNNGTVNGNMGGGFGGTESGPTTGTVVNNGTVTENMNVYAFGNGTATGVVGKNGVVEGQFNGGSSEGDSNTTMTNNGTVSSLSSWAEDDGTTTVANNGTVTDTVFAGTNQNSTLLFENNGTVSGEVLYAESRDDSSMTITNNGEIAGTLEISTRHESDSSTTNNGHIGDMMFIEASQNATATGVNKGTVDGVLISAVQDWDEEEGFNFANVGSATSSVANDGEVGDVSTFVYGEGTASSVNNGTVGGESWTEAYGSGAAETVNNGEIAKGMGSYAADGGQTSLVNNGSVPSVTVEFEANTSGRSGSTTVTGSGSTGKLTIGVYAAPDVDISTAEAKQKIANDVASGLSVYAGQLGLTEGNTTVSVVIYDENGEKIATVEAEVPLMPAPQPEEEYKPSEWEIRHQMEEKRKAESLAGVYASPYWCRQMYLGYHSLNFRVFDAAGKNVLIRERLSWIDGGPRKNLNLRVRTDETEGLTIRFDEEVLEILERTEIDTITLLTYTEKEPFMQYKVSDLRAAFAKFGLARTDLLVIGGMDDEVMKIGADGKMVPVE